MVCVRVYDYIFYINLKERHEMFLYFINNIVDAIKWKWLLWNFDYYDITSY